jgi:hypothetical protein
MIATAIWLTLLTPGQVSGLAPNDNPAQVEAAKAKDSDEKRQARIGAGRVLFKDLTLLAILSILIMTLGALMLVSRMGRRLRNQKKPKPVKYFDMTVGDGPEPPPHEPTAEERFGER